MNRNNLSRGVVTLSFSSLTDLPVQAHVSTRHGGVSPQPWKSLNFSISRGDTAERVARNFYRLCNALEIESGDVVRTEQVHGTTVAKVDHSDAGSRQKATDALITDAVGLPLFLVFADCVPVLLYDSENHALGLCHAGWRGTVNGAAEATLWAMQAAYGTNPAHVFAAIGPSIGPESYEVGDEVVDWVQARLEDGERFLRWTDQTNGKAHLDLWRANASQLARAGVPDEQIEIAGIDTATNTQDFFSHRAEKGRCGLFSMIGWLEPRNG